MNIGIDARMFGPNVGGGGLGRYVEQLVQELAKQNNKNRYLLFLKNKDQQSQIDEHKFETRLTNTHWYTLKEQLVMPGLIDKEKLDLIHFPHWNVPLHLKTPFIVTIHDLILLEEPHSAKATTKHPFVYAAKYQAYKLALSSALKRSKKIIAVSHYTKSAILNHFPQINEEKIHVIYEGITDLANMPINKDAPSSNRPYFLYVGNAYPHKNLESLLHAFSFFHKLHPEVKLILAGRNDIFYERLRKELNEIDVEENAVEFIMSPSDQELANLYRNASLYLFPSRSEGFGLPPLEAMSFNVPVAAAKRTSLPEILGDAAIYFEPDDIEEMVEVMERALTDKQLRTQLKERGSKQIQKYSWETMAKEIQSLYQDCV
jgi:glycosyltransferase involved in cell wall biosynthesis